MRIDHSKCHLLALTSESNRQFVEDLGLYDAVMGYDNVPDGLGSTIYLDFSGDAEIRRRVHERVGSNLLDSIIVGATHWRDHDAVPVSGPTPREFFAPSVMSAKTAEWGGAEFAKRFKDAWWNVLDWTPKWINIVRLVGQTGLVDAYRRLQTGRLQPSEGLWVDLSRGVIK